MSEQSDVEQIGPYRVLRELSSEGGLQRFEVEDPEVANRRLWLSFLPGDAPASAVRRFEAQVQLLSDAESPYLPALLRCERELSDDGRAFRGRYYTTAAQRGQSLADARLAPGDESVALVGSLLDAVSVLHERGVVHGELDLDSATLLSDGRLMLAKLGAVALADDPELASFELTRFSAPECVCGMAASRASDVFSAGAMLYELLAKQSVYAALTNEGAAAVSATALAFRLGELRGASAELDLSFPSSVPAPLCELIRRACRLDPAERDADAGDLAFALRRSQFHPSSETLGPVLPSDLGGPSALRWPARIAAGAAIAALVVLAFVAGMSSQRAPSQPETSSRATVAQLRAALLQTDRYAASLLSGIRVLDPALPAKAIATVEHEMRVARRARDRGQEELEASEFESAAQLLALADTAYGESCARISRDVLGARVASMRARLPGLLPAVQTAGPATGSAPRASHSETPCARAVDELAWLGALAEASQLASEPTPAQAVATTAGRAAVGAIAAQRPERETRTRADTAPAVEVAAPIVLAASDVSARSAPIATRSAPSATRAAPIAAPPAPAARRSASPPPREGPEAARAAASDAMVVAPAEASRTAAFSEPSQPLALPVGALAQGAGEAPDQAAGLRAEDRSGDGVPSAGGGTIAAVTGLGKAGEPRDAGDAAMAALVEYERAYESMDLPRLERAWKMTPDQRRSLRVFFSQMDEVALEIERHAVQLSDGRAAIDFGLRIDASGPQHSASTGGSVAMRAHIQHIANDYWWIARIEPR